jgi:hypothetical protein
MKKNKFVKNEMGVCPVCGKRELNFVNEELRGTQMFFDWICMNCNAEGTEVYDLVFNTHQGVDTFEEGENENE